MFWLWLQVTTSWHMPLHWLHRVFAALGGASLCFNFLMSVHVGTKYHRVRVGLDGDSSSLRSGWCRTTRTMSTRRRTPEFFEGQLFNSESDCLITWNYRIVEVFAYPLIVHIRIYPSTLSHQLDPPALARTYWTHPSLCNQRLIEIGACLFIANLASLQQKTAKSQIFQ